MTARYLGEEHLTKGHRSQEPVVLSKYQTTADWYIERDLELARQASKIQSELLADWTKKHPANVAVNVAVTGDKESFVM